jgi:hypothetical protein
VRSRVVSVFERYLNLAVASRSRSSIHVVFERYLNLAVASRSRSSTVGRGRDPVRVIERHLKRSTCHRCRSITYDLIERHRPRLHGFGRHPITRRDG